jgi:hypothetical protein
LVLVHAQDSFGPLENLITIHKFYNALCLGATESEHFGDSHQIGQ